MLEPTTSAAAICSPPPQPQYLYERYAEIQWYLPSRMDLTRLFHAMQRMLLPSACSFPDREHKMSPSSILQYFIWKPFCRQSFPYAGRPLLKLCYPQELSHLILVQVLTTIQGCY